MTTLRAKRERTTKMKTMLVVFALLALVVFVPRTSDADAGAAPPMCRDNLCGMDSYCSCHEVGQDERARRCWTTEVDCKVDLQCCVAWGGCNGMVEDTCTAKVRAERKRRDGKK